MRIGFLGKGGSGKTTIAAGYASWIAEKGRAVLAIDADVNVHLGAALGMKAKGIGGLFPEIVADLEPKRKDRDMFIGTTPPSMDSIFIRPNAGGAFLEKYATGKGIIRLLTIGTYDESHAGSECYHTMLGAAEFIGSRLLDGADGRVVFDMTAGIDSIGTSMFFIADLNAFVIEPTMKSVKVYLDFKERSKGFGITIRAILNKVEDAGDEKFVRAHIASPEILAVFPQSRRMKEFEQGNAGALKAFVAENTLAFAQIDSALSSLKKDWDGYYDKLLKVYRDNCATWYNGFYGRDLSEFIDPSFSYKKVFDEC